MLPLDNAGSADNLTIMKRLGALIVAIFALSAAPALSCSRVPFERWQPSVRPMALPAKMVADAALVEVAVAERRELVDIDAFLSESFKADLARAGDDAERREIREDMAWKREELATAGLARVSFRIVERLKGGGPDTFKLTAFSTQEPDDGLTPATALQSRGDYGKARQVYDAPKWVQADAWGGFGSCTAPISVVIGQHYLIFRGADGNLLGERPMGFVPLNQNLSPGSVFEPVTASDPWLARVRKAARR
jgi:hypothetical protein